MLFFLAFFFAPHFFFHLRHRCVFVLLLKILEYEGERVFCGRALTVVLLRLRVKGEEGRSTLRLTMIITTFIEVGMSRAAALISTNNNMSQF